MTSAVNAPNDEISALRKQWCVLDPLVAGTPGMRHAGAALLPKWPAEEDESYKARLATATLFPAYERTVSVMSGKPFSKAVTLSDDVPGSIKTWSEDIDLQGVSLHGFCAEMFEESFAGLAGILIEYPDTTPHDAEGKRIEGPAPQRTVAEVEAAGHRPYWVRVKHDQILGWKAQLQGGKMTLTQLRLSETREEDDGPFGTKHVPVVRVLYPGRWETYEQAKGKDDWIITDSGVTSLPYIPFVPVYGKRKAFMCGVPPLLSLAYLNVKHWQSQSDQDTILHVARVPILAVFTSDDKFKLTVGSATAVRMPAEQGADIKYVEHTGAAIEAGAASLVALEDQMIQTGAELLVQKPGDRSATEAAGDQEANKCDLQRMAEGFEDSIDQALQITADYVKLGSGGSVSLFKDYGAALLSDASATLVKDLNMAGLITKKTTLREMQRRGVIEANIDVEDEIEEAAAEGPPLGAMPDDEPVVP